MCFCFMSEKHEMAVEPQARACIPNGADCNKALYDPDFGYYTDTTPVSNFLID